jgi:hypothetical protein
MATPTKSQVIRFLAFGLGFWLTALILAFFFGVGWFFLVGAIRRLLLAIPASRLALDRMIFGEQHAALTKEKWEQAGRRRWLSLGLGSFVTLAWLVLAGIAFARFNFPLIDLLR